jgi:hypothetical protein
MRGQLGRALAAVLLVGIVAALVVATSDDDDVSSAAGPPTSVEPVAGKPAEPVERSVSSEGTGSSEDTVLPAPITLPPVLGDVPVLVGNEAWFNTEATSITELYDANDVVIV